MTTDERDFWNYCAHCGAELGIRDWPPVVETISDGDKTIVYSFCDEDCKTAWDGDD